MEARRAAALIMAEADFLLEITVIVLDAPAHLGDIDELAERHLRVDGCEPAELFARHDKLLRPKIRGNQHWGGRSDKIARHAVARDRPLAIMRFGGLGLNSSGHRPDLREQV